MLQFNFSLPNYSVLDYQQDSLMHYGESVVGSLGYYYTPHKILIAQLNAACKVVDNTCRFLLSSRLNLVEINENEIKII